MRPRLTHLGVTALAGLLLLLIAPAALAGPDEVATSVSQKVMSPYCPGLTLHDCPSDAAAELREDIAGWAREGMTQDEIIDRLEAEFGAGILATPPAEGSGLMAWVLPIAGLLIAVGVGVVLARRWAARASTDTDVTQALATDPRDRTRLEAELRDLREQS